MDSKKHNLQNMKMGYHNILPSLSFCTVYAAVNFNFAFFEVYNPRSFFISLIFLFIV